MTEEKIKELTEYASMLSSNNLERKEIKSALLRQGADDELADSIVAQVCKGKIHISYADDDDSPKALRPNSKRADNAILLIWVVLGIQIISLISSIMQYNLLNSAGNGGYIPPGVAEANDMRERVIAWFFLTVFGVSAFTFISWFRRAYFNLHQKVTWLAYSDAWAAGGWFIPFINWFRPYKIMSELYVETRELFVRKSITYNGNTSRLYVNWWWTLWMIVSLTGSYIYNATVKGSKTIDDWLNITTADIISGILYIPLAIITVKVIKDYSRMEQYLPQVSDTAPTTSDCITQEDDSISHEQSNNVLNNNNG